MCGVSSVPSPPVSLSSHRCLPCPPSHCLPSGFSPSPGLRPLLSLQWRTERLKSSGWMRKILIYSVDVSCAPLCVTPWGLSDEQDRHCPCLRGTGQRSFHQEKWVNTMKEEQGVIKSVYCATKYWEHGREGHVASWVPCGQFPAFSSLFVAE